MKVCGSTIELPLKLGGLSIFGLFLEMVALKVAVRSFRELSLRTKAGDNIMAGDRTSRLMIFTKRC